MSEEEQAAAAQQELPNVITKSVYEDFPPGEHIVGLVELKLVDADIWENGNKTGKTEKKYRVVFRGLENPKAFLTLGMRPLWNEKSTMFQVLRAMSEKKLKPSSTPEDAFRFLKSSLGKWFVVDVAISKHGKIALVTNDAIMQCREGAPEVGAVEYFAEKDGSTGTPN